MSYYEGTRQWLAEIEERREEERLHPRASPEPPAVYPIGWGDTKLGTPQQLLGLARAVNNEMAAKILRAAARKVALAVDLIDRERWRSPGKLIESVQVARVESGFNPHGDFVYCLWGRIDDRPGEHPLYIGRSSNILTRLGTHVGNTKKRQAITRVSLLKCADFADSVRLEQELITRYEPPWNIQLVYGRNRSSVK